MQIGFLGFFFCIVVICLGEVGVILLMNVFILFFLFFVFVLVLEFVFDYLEVVLFLDGDIVDVK